MAHVPGLGVGTTAGHNTYILINVQCAPELCGEHTTQLWEAGSDRCFQKFYESGEGSFGGMPLHCCQKVGGKKMLTSWAW